MHAKFFRRLPTELVHLRKRLSSRDNGNGGDSNSGGNNSNSNGGGNHSNNDKDRSEDDTGGDDAFTTPITITVTETSQSTVTPPPVIVLPSSFPSSATSTTPTSSSSTTTTNEVPSATTSTQSTLSVSSSSHMLAPSPTIVIGNSTASGHSSNDSTKSEKSNSQSLSAGATAGIVIACLLLLIVAVVFGLRKRSVRNRLRSRGMWARSKGINPLPGTLTSYETKEVAPAGNLPIYTSFQAGETSPGAHFGRAQAAAMASRVPVPPLDSPRPVPQSYGADSLPNPFDQRLATATATQSPRLNPTPDMLSPFGLTVKCTFIPTLPDELSIVTGETIRVLAEYDDGWALCFNGRGEQGMVPLACLDRGFNEATQQENYEYRGSRRVSSLAATARYMRRG